MVPGVAEGARRQGGADWLTGQGGARDFSHQGRAGDWKPLGGPRLQPGLSASTQFLFTYHFPSDFRDNVWVGLDLGVMIWLG